MMPRLVTQLPASIAEKCANRLTDHPLAPDPREQYALLQLLQFLEHLPKKANGFYAVEGESTPLGQVFVHEGRLCWASAFGMERRLSELLCAATDGQIQHAGLREAYQTCRATSEPLLSHLIQTQKTTQGALQHALLTHAADSLLQLAPYLPETPSWPLFEECDFTSSVTFSSLAIATAINRLRDPDAADSASGALRRVAASGAFAAAFRFPETPLDACPVACQHEQDQPLAAALHLGRWAYHQLQRCQAPPFHWPKQDSTLQSPGASHRLPSTSGVQPLGTSTPSNLSAIGIRGDGTAVITWPFGHGLCTTVCDNAAQMARVLSCLSRTP